MITAAKLRHRVQLERDVLTYASGAEIRTPVEYGSPRAKVEFLSGAEKWLAQEVNASVTVRVSLRYRPWAGQVKTQDRVIYKGRRLEITAVLPDEDERQLLVLECKAN